MFSLTEELTEEKMTLNLHIPQNAGHKPKSLEVYVFLSVKNLEAEVLRMWFQL
jgi:hypothetical protein